MTRPSLRTRLLVPLLVILLVGLAGAPILASVVMKHHLDERVGERLSATSRTIGGTLSGRPQVRLTEAQMALVPTAGGVLLVGLDSAGEVAFVLDRRGPSTADTDLGDLVAAAVAHPTGQIVDSESEGTSYSEIRASTPGLTVAKDHGDVAVAQIVVAVDRSEDQAVVRTLERAGAVFAVVAMVVLGGLAAWTLGRGLRPLARMAEAAGSAATDEPRGADGFRAASVGAAPELARLGAALADAFEARAQAEQAVRSFMLDASHELRTPLTGLSGWLDLYAQGGLRESSELERAMERMESEVGRMRLLVDELDLLARMDQGLPLELADLPMRSVLEGIVDDAHVIDPRRRIDLEIGGDPVVRADERRLEQVIRNVIGNALQHTPPGTSLEVRVVQDDTGVAVAVVDHGPGITEPDLDLVFERFHRAASARTEPGMGLGLAIVRALTEAHGGTVAASVTPGGGATVTIRLPLSGAAVATVSGPSGSA